MKNENTFRVPFRDAEGSKTVIAVSTLQANCSRKC